MRTRSIALALVLAVGLTGPALAAGSKKKEEPKANHETVYNEGVALLEKGDHAAAADKFRQALEAKEEFAEAHNNLAYCLRKQGADNYQEARDHYDRALELDPKLAQAYHYRGVLHALAGDEAAAKADHKALLELDRELADELMKVIASGEEPPGHGGAAKRWN